MERNYESMMILKPDLGEKGCEDIFQKIIKKIEGLEGKVVTAKIWAKERNLYYPLRSSGAEKKKYTRAGYWLINFMLATDKLPDLKETIRLEEGILRSLIIRLSK